MIVPDDVTVIIVTYNSAHVVPSLAYSLRFIKSVIIVDNASSDLTMEAVKSILPDALCISMGRNVGFGRANNVGLMQVVTPFALLLNPDCTLQPGAYKGLLSAAKRYPNAAILAPKLYDAPGKLGLCYRPPFHVPQPKTLIDPEGDVCSEFLTGAAMLLRMDVFRRIGFFDPWFFLYLEDDDLCMRARKAGYSLVLVNDACGEHRVKQSSRPSSRLDYRRAYCATASKLYALNKHLGTERYRRARYRALFGAPLALIGALLTMNRRRILRSLGRLVAAWRAPRLLRQPHCIESLD